MKRSTVGAALLGAALAAAGAGPTTAPSEGAGQRSATTRPTRRPLTITDGVLKKFDDKTVTIEVPAAGDEKARDRTFPVGQSTQIVFARMVAKHVTDNGKTIKSYGTSPGATVDDLTAGRSVIVVQRDGEDVANCVGVLVDDAAAN